MIPTHTLQKIASRAPTMTRIPPRPIPPRPVRSDAAISRLPLVAFTGLGTRYAPTACAPLDEPMEPRPVSARRKLRNAVDEQGDALASHAISEALRSQGKDATYAVTRLIDTGAQAAGDRRGDQRGPRSSRRTTCSSGRRLPWYEIHDDLPQHDERPPS